MGVEKRNPAHLRVARRIWEVSQLSCREAQEIFSAAMWHMFWQGLSFGIVIGGAVAIISEHV